MDIKRSGSHQPSIGPADWFTGTASVDTLFQPSAPARAVSLNVTFDPGARTAWHTHPLRSDADRDGRLRARAALGRSDRRNSTG